MRIKTNFKALDDMMQGGFDIPSLIVLGARPGMGKTAFLLSMAANFIENTPFVFYSLESSNEINKKKLLSMHSDVEISKIDDDFSGRKLAPLEKKRFEISKKAFEANPFDLCEVRDFEILIEGINNLESFVKVIFIDSLQCLIAGKDYDETNKIIMTLKNLAHENDICIILSSQLNRKVEERQGRRPILTDFRDSGMIEEITDVAMLLTRRAYYDPLDKPGLGELIIAKNRNGTTGDLRMTWRKEIAQFVNYTSFKQEKEENEDPFAPFVPN